VDGGQEGTAVGLGCAKALHHRIPHCPATSHPPRRFRERLEPVKEHLPEAAQKVIEEELEKLQVRLRLIRAVHLLRGA